MKTEMFIDGLYRHFTFLTLEERENAEIVFLP